MQKDLHISKKIRTFAGEIGIMHNNEPLYFLSFCIEAYKTRHHLTGEETLQLFDRMGVTQYLLDGYDTLHTQGEQWIMEDIDEYLHHHQ